MIRRLSTVFRFRTKNIDPQQVGRDLGARAVLVRAINSRAAGVAIAVELVEVSNGRQLWGESFDSARKDLLEIQAAITRQLLAALKLQLTGEEEKRVTARALSVRVKNCIARIARQQKSDDGNISN